MELLKHQVEGINRIKKDGSLLLGDEPGVGKTAQMIHATKDYDEVLIVTLASLKYQMREEILKWLPDAKVIVVQGDKEERASIWEDVRLGAWQFVIINYELLLRDFPLMQKDWDYIVCDEATRLSNIKNKQYKALRQLKSKHRLPMTGTPVSNRPDDVYGLLDWARPGCLGNWWDFMNRYVVRNPQKWIVGYRNMEELAVRIRPFMLRRTKEEVLDLPDKIVASVPFELGAKERKLYDQLKKGLLLDIEQAEVNKIKSLSGMDLAVSKFGKLCELCDSMELLGEGTDSAKLAVLQDLLTTLNGSKVIIFTRFSRMADIIQRELGCLKITGDIDLVERMDILRQFELKHNVLVMTNAGEYGLNIQAANVIIHFDQPMSIARKEQREGRAHRMGQTKKVLIYNLLADKTVDTAMFKRIEKKADLSRLLLSDLKELLNEEV